MFKLGTTLTDKITGFKGTAMAKIEYLNGCIQYELQPTKLTKDGKRGESIWFDEGQLKGKKITTKKSNPGGPAPGDSYPSLGMS